MLWQLPASGSALGNPPLGDWRTPINVEALLGSSDAINSPSIDGCVSLSRNGLELYFTSFRDGSADIFVTPRETTSDGFGVPQKLPPTVNTGANEACPTIIGRNELHFLRSEDSDHGNLFVSRRNSGNWEPAHLFNLPYNTPGLEESVNIFEDDARREVVIFPAATPTVQAG